MIFAFLNLILIFHFCFHITFTIIDIGMIAV